jgi:DNA-directed RNA polymerases I and III subunit RPAC1
MTFLVYSGDLKWVPQGAQSSLFAAAPIRPVQNDILLIKMRPGQEISLEAHCEKNIGREHAKWSPVCTATYRLLPTILLLEPITGQDAYKFVECFAPGVIAVESVNGILFI